MHKIIHGTDSTTLSFSYEATTSQPTSRILATSPSPATRNCTNDYIKLSAKTARCRNQIFTLLGVYPLNFDSFHRTTLLFGSNGFYYSTFTAHNEPQMRLPSLHVSRICHHPKPAYSSKPHQPGRGNVPVDRNPNPKPHKRQNQTIRKNSTMP